MAAVTNTPAEIDLTLVDSSDDEPLASSSRARPIDIVGHRHAPRQRTAGSSRSAHTVYIDISSGEDDPIVETDRNGRPVQSRIVMPGFRAPSPVHLHQSRPRRSSPRADGEGLTIVEQPPILEDARPAHNSPLPASIGGLRAGLGGAILSIRQAVGARRTRQFNATSNEGPFNLNDANTNQITRISELLERLRNHAYEILSGDAYGANPDVPQPPLNDAPEYDAKFTHGGKLPRTAFTFDFDRDPSTSAWKPFPLSSDHLNGNGKRKQAPGLPAVSRDDDDDEGNMPTLVCSGCDKELMLGLDGSDRLWALRCGHLICGGCLDRVGLPPSPPPPSLFQLLDQNVESYTRGHKGKERHRADSEAQHLVGSSELPDASLSGATTGHNLRSRGPVPAPVPTTTPPAPAATKRTRKRGRAGRLRTFREWEYACPVTDCGLLHSRLLVGSRLDDAQWRPKGETGEVAVYT